LSDHPVANLLDARLTRRARSASLLATAASVFARYRRGTRDQALVLQLFPERVGDPRTAVREIRFHIGGASHPRHDARDRGMRERELQRRRGERDAVARAYRLDAQRSRDDLGVCQEVE
jgi:hypothetical protein